jgi:hypothetical protein
VRRQAELMLDQIDFFRYTADTRRMPEVWDSLRRRLAGELRPLRDELGH